MQHDLKARFLNFVYKVIEHSNSKINHHVTKHACRNPMSVCGRNCCDIVCKNGNVSMSVKEIYNEWYETCNEEMDCIAVLKEMIDVRKGRGSCHVFFLNTKQVSPSLLVVLVTFWKIALCYNGLFHFTLKVTCMQSIGCHI